MSSILILIPSFNNKHTINVTVYIGFGVYAQFKERKEKNVKGCIWKKTAYQYLKLKEWRQKKIRCAAYKILDKNVFY